MFRERRTERDGRTSDVDRADTQRRKRMSRIMKVVVLGALILVLSAGTALAATLVGTEGDDNMSGSGVADQIFTLEGNDTVDGMGGNDEIYGNENNDFLIGAEGSDTLYGNTGNDAVDLASFDIPGDSDQGYGGKGNDTIGAQDGNFDLVNCGAGGSDVAFFDAGIDKVAANCETRHPR
jgi:Ca2+-binding RTX toxin-like protein